MYEFKNLKVRIQRTGKEGIKKIKQGFSFFDYMDSIIGQWDSVDPSKMHTETTTTLSERRNSPASETCEDTESKEEQSCGEDSTGSSCTLGRYKRKLNEGARLKSTKKAKRKRENIESDWKERFEKMWERSLEL